jgi:D-alanine-D-alanine ligase
MDTAGYEVIRALEYYNLAYTGADEKFFSLKKSSMKSLALSCGINTPNYCFAYSDEDIILADKQIGTYPMFVKHFNGGGSIGLNAQSKCHCFDEMRDAARKMIDEFGGALIEEFIQGREYTVLIIENDKNKFEPFVLDPIECVFDNGETFKTYHLKHIDATSNIKVENGELRAKLVDMSKKAFVFMQAKSYARVDIRVDPNGKLYFLEINAQPTIFWHLPQYNDADFIIKENTVLTPEEIVYQIINIGLEEFKKRQLPYYVSFARDAFNQQGNLYSKQPNSVLRSFSSRTFRNLHF